MSGARPTIDDFTPGSPYTVGAVAKFFGVSSETVRKWIGSGQLKANRFNSFRKRKLEPRAHYYIDGAEVRRAYGAELLEQDACETPKPDDAAKRAARRLDELAKASA